MASSLMKPCTVATTHTVFIAAPPRAVYRLIADASRWSYLFPPIVHVERLAAGANEDRLRLWTVGHGAVRSWVSRRSLDCDGLRIRFRQENPAPPVASMSGEWVFVPLPGNATSVVLLHEFRAIDDDPGNTALIKQAVDRNSTAELAAVKRIAELGDRLAMLVYSFADSMTIAAPPGPVYDFLYRVQEWPRRMPHISRLILDETVPGVQTVELDARNSDGSLQTRNLVRVCFPYHGIVFKQTQPPDIMSAHVGSWHLYPTADGVRVTSHNTVMIRPERAGDVLGQHSAGQNGAGLNGVGQSGVGQSGAGLNGAGQNAAGELIRQALRKNCLAILAHAKQSAESGPHLVIGGSLP